MTTITTRGHFKCSSQCEKGNTMCSKETFHPLLLFAKSSGSTVFRPDLPELLNIFSFFCDGGGGHNNGSFEKCDTVLESLILRNGWHMHMVFSSYKSASWQISRKARTINGADDVKHSISKKPRLSAL